MGLTTILFPGPGSQTGELRETIAERDSLGLLALRGRLMQESGERQRDVELADA